MMATTAVASSEVFTYKNAMKEDIDHVLVKAMIKVIEDHEAQEHWTMIERTELPHSVKTIMSIWSSK